jgi:hypothetical protein
MTSSSDSRYGVAHAEVSAEISRASGKKRTVLEEGSEAPEVRVSFPKGSVHAEIEVAVGATVGLPSYSAARFDVRLRLPCKPDLESVERAYAAGLAFVRMKLTELKASVEET